MIILKLTFCKFIRYHSFAISGLYFKGKNSDLSTFVYSNIHSIARTCVFESVLNH